MGEASNADADVICIADPDMICTADPDMSCRTIRMRCSTFGERYPKIELDKPFPEWQAQVSSRSSDKESAKYYFSPEISFKAILCFALTVTSQRYFELIVTSEPLHLETRGVERDHILVSPPINWQSSTKPLSKLISDLLFALPLRCPRRCSIVPGCNTAVHMKPRLWSNLPIELVTKIIMTLPLQSLVPLRSLGKDWKRLACDPSIDSIFALSNPVLKDRTPSYPPIYICLLQNNQYGVYNPTSNAWNVLSHSFIPKYYPVTPFHRIVVANAGSILLLRGAKHGSRFFFVVNPVNKSERQLPALPHPRIHMLRSMKVRVLLLRCGAWIAVDKKTGGFQVFSVEEYVVDPGGDGHDTKSINFLNIYDSRSDSWTLTYAPLPGLQSERIRNVVIFKDHILCLVERRLESFMPFVKNRYEMYRVNLQEAWQQEDACMNMSLISLRSEDWLDMFNIMKQKCWERCDCSLPENMYGTKLFVCGEVLMLATGMAETGMMQLEGESSCLLAVEFWMFSLERRQWVKVQTMPDELLAHVSSGDPKFTERAYLDDFQHYNIQINGDYVAVNNFHTGRTVMSDVSKTLWWLLPPLPTDLPDEQTSRTSFLVEPSLQVP